MASGRVEPGELPGRALLAWLRELRDPGYPGLMSGGAAGRLFALRIAAIAWPTLAGVAAAMRARLCGYVATRPWATCDVGWADYDLVTGPAGILLAFAADPAIDAASRVPLVAHLAQLCAEDDLRGLRVGQYRDEELRGWNYGGINLGLAHGLPGVVAALRAAADVDGLTPVTESALRHLTGRLLAESCADARGVLTWPFGSDGTAGTAGGTAGTAGRPSVRTVRRTASRREAWCYGCPGIAWTLWEAGRVLGEPELQAFAGRAAASFIDAYDDDFYLCARPGDDFDRETLGICHGAAGLLVIFDAFTRHAGLPGAAELRDHLAGYLGDRLDAVVGLARRDSTLQCGASGVLAALLTAADGDRHWLAALGLR
jgi:hypothetical protein